MTQVQAIILCLKIVEVSAICTTTNFTGWYSKWAPWWKDQIGATIVIENILLVLALVPTVLSLFFDFSRLTSDIAAWTDIALVGLISPVMIWRTLVFGQIHQQGAALSARPPAHLRTWIRRHRHRDRADQPTSKGQNQ